ncbi:hypothetical protein OO013_07910 [Mangrovivirga sp. M17]|uniref:GLPGLI family protein n=1 Tax=Mangrovivirga halotolerans TaxID=2993936 RepID=A0ABT3RRH1_9BACT|nr:hypothetical protein [Mangrovivirga halotolerans]MCX2743785.1 hypothetical protein [Mangrovivirga halotolerans]
MKIVLYIILSLLVGQQMVAQIDISKTLFDSATHKRIYQISISDYQQIELIEDVNGQYSGTLTSAVWKVNRKEERKKILQQKLTIPSKHVQEIMNIGSLNNIENLESCKDVKGCVIGLDGRSVFFTIKTSKLSREYWYWEPENDQYQDSSVVQIKNIRQILKGIRKYIDLKMIFDSFINELPFGKYSFGGVIITKRVN